VIGGSGDEFAVEAAADEEGEAVVAEGPHSGEEAGVPEGVDGGRGDFEAGGGAGLADVFVAEGGAETEANRAGKARDDGQDDPLFQGVVVGHRLSLPV